MAKANWNKIEVEYVTSRTSYSKLAKKHNISKSSVEKYGTEHDWVQKRRDYCNKVKAEAILRAGEKDIDRLAKVKKATDDMADVLEEMLKDKKQFRRQIINGTDRNGQSVQKEKVMKKYDTRAMTETARALRDISASIRDLYEVYATPDRLAQDAAQLKMDIEIEKLQLAKDKGAEIETEAAGVIEIAPVVGELNE